VILDEPTSGLDPIGCREVKDLILALARRGKTVLLSSHLLADVEDVCDRVVIYYGGRIQAMGSLKELLAAPDAIRLTLPALPCETLERVLAFIRQDVAESRISIDTPTQNLERYFLEVVQNARLAEAETSGAVSGARVAAYLRGEAEAAPASDKILERLAAPPPARPAPTPAPKPDETVDRQKLEALIKPSEPAAPPPPPPAAEKPSTTEELRQANEKLASLVRKQKE